MQKMMLTLKTLHVLATMLPILLNGTSEPTPEKGEQLKSFPQKVYSEMIMKLVRKHSDLPDEIGQLIASMLEMVCAGCRKPNDMMYTDVGKRSGYTSSKFSCSAKIEFSREAGRNFIEYVNNDKYSRKTTFRKDLSELKGWHCGDCANKNDEHFPCGLFGVGRCSECKESHRERGSVYYDKKAACITAYSAVEDFEKTKGNLSLVSRDSTSYGYPRKNLKRFKVHADRTMCASCAPEDPLCEFPCGKNAYRNQFVYSEEPRGLYRLDTSPDGTGLYLWTWGFKDYYDTALVIKFEKKFLGEGLKLCCSRDCKVCHGIPEEEEEQKTPGEKEAPLEQEEHKTPDAPVPGAPQPGAEEEEVKNDSVSQSNEDGDSRPEGGASEHPRDPSECKVNFEDTSAPLPECSEPSVPGANNRPDQGEVSIDSESHRGQGNSECTIALAKSLSASESDDSQQSTERARVFPRMQEMPEES